MRLTFAARLSDGSIEKTLLQQKLAAFLSAPHHQPFVDPDSQLLFPTIELRHQKVGVATLRRFVLDRCDDINQPHFVEHLRKVIGNHVIHTGFCAPLKEGPVKGSGKHYKKVPTDRHAPNELAQEPTRFHTFQSI